jgi:cytochrome c5
MTASRAIALLLLAGSLSAQEDPPMEQTKKNIKVLTGVPSSQLIPVMTVMANSLGVTCAYCHETEFASDAKPAKEAGRRMIRLTRAINDTHYGGKVVVTCNTCHNGQVSTAALPRVADAGWNKPPTVKLQPALPDAEELFARYVRAWGTAEARAAVRNRLGAGVASARSGRGDPRSAPFELYQELPERKELKMELPYPPEADREFIHQFFNYAGIRERYASVATVAADEVRGRAAWVVEATPKDGGMVERLWFDAASGVLLRRHRERPTLVGPLPEEYDFDDYRTVDGVAVPFLLQWSRADYQVTHRFATVKHNVTR